jgi:hypothetical protein
MADNHTEHTDALFGQIKMLLNFAARGRHSYHHNSLYNHVTTTDSFPLLDIFQKVYRKKFKILLLMSPSCLSLVIQSLYHISPNVVHIRNIRNYQSTVCTVYLIYLYIERDGNS